MVITNQKLIVNTHTQKEKNLNVTLKNSPNHNRREQQKKKCTESKYKNQLIK